MARELTTRFLSLGQMVALNEALTMWRDFLSTRYQLSKSEIEDVEKSHGLYIRSGSCP